MTLGKGDSDNYFIMRDNITGGLSNTHHRLNIGGESEITKVKINENKLEIEHTNSIITHWMGVDTNNLYPSCFSSSINPNILYTGGQMYIPGRLLQSFKCDTKKQKAYTLSIILEKKDLFIAEVKISCPEDKKNQFVNFPPIMRNIGITNSKGMIGEAMYNYMKENWMKVDGRSVKLTQLLDTHLCNSGRNDTQTPGFIAISSYYLLLLIDNGFIIKDVKSMMTFSKHTGFKGFVEEFMKLRQQAILDKNKGLGKIYKLCLNSSYGQEIIKEEKFTKVMLCITHRVINNHLKSNLINTVKFNNDVYQ
jgi:hypothetical protein